MVNKFEQRKLGTGLKLYSVKIFLRNKNIIYPQNKKNLDINHILI